MSSLFYTKLESLWRKKRYICVGLDSDYSRLPPDVKKGRSVYQALTYFNKQIVDQTFDLVLAYKPNSAFYEAYGQDGWLALQETARYISKKYPQISLILDAKRADIASTNEGYIKMAFDELGFDAITVHPYLGQEALQPFLDRKDKGIIVLVRTSNPGASEFQDLLCKNDGMPLYQIVAKKVSQSWNVNGNCAVVVGATYPNELGKVRQIVGDIPILIPGIGFQGGGLKSIIEAGRGKRGFGMIINSSRGIIFASPGRNFAQAARGEVSKLNNEIKSLI